MQNCIFFFQKRRKLSFIFWDEETEDLSPEKLDHEVRANSFFYKVKPMQMKVAALQHFLLVVEAQTSVKHPWVQFPELHFSKLN